MTGDEERFPDLSTAKVMHISAGRRRPERKDHQTGPSQPGSRGM